MSVTSDRLGNIMSGLRGARPTAAPSRVRELEEMADPDQLVIACWCERTFGLVSKKDVWEGLSFSCGHPWCRRSG